MEVDAEMRELYDTDRPTRYARVDRYVHFSGSIFVCAID